MKTQDTWFLWGFLSAEGSFILTRGRTQYEAEIWAAYNVQCAVHALSVLPVNAAKAYSRTHPFDWLHTPPQWTKQLENEFLAGQLLNEVKHASAHASGR